MQFNWTVEKKEQLTAQIFLVAGFPAHNTALENSAVAKSWILVNFIIVKDFHHVQRKQISEKTLVLQMVAVALILSLCKMCSL